MDWLKLHYPTNKLLDGYCHTMCVPMCHCSCTKNNNYKKQHEAQRRGQDEVRTWWRIKCDRKLRKMEIPTSESVWNIANGCVTNEKINVQDTVAIECKMANDFLDDFPVGFHKTVYNQVVTMEIMKEGFKIGSQTIYQSEHLCVRLLVISQKLNLSLSFDLAPLPTALFDEYGLMRNSTKSILTSKLVEEYHENNPVNFQLLDVNEMIYHADWPKMHNNTEKNYPVYLIFDIFTIQGNHKKEYDMLNTRC